MPLTVLSAALEGLGLGDRNDIRAEPVGGGSINQAFRVTTGTQRLFVKLNDPDCLSMFDAEADGLAALDQAGAVRVPEVLGSGVFAGKACLVLAYIDLHTVDGENAACFGERLAVLHRMSAERFGWFRDNTIGATHQSNNWSDDWAVFFTEYRLAAQLSLAARQGYGGNFQSLGRALLKIVPKILSGHAVTPSLLHGDLWRGNCAVDSRGRPVLFDPACYFGDRECDLAMTELFGRLPESFYQAYSDAWPLDEGYALRRDCYNLYHLLNHANLFGGGYVDQAITMMKRLLD